MTNAKFDVELAAHNVATILTQASMGEIDKEQLPLSVAIPDVQIFDTYAKKYAYYYKNFYNKALDHFESVLNDCN